MGNPNVISSFSRPFTIRGQRYSFHETKMTRSRNHRARSTKKKDYKKAHCTARRRKDIDQVQDDIEKVADLQTDNLVFDVDDDLPGLGQFYCLQCAKHFADKLTLDQHKKSKPHKRRVKDVAQTKYTQEEADRAAGKTKELLPKLRNGVSRME